MLADGPGINVKVIDFGLAKIVGAHEDANKITYDGFVGTPAFASPEQFLGSPIDHRSDYFSLGVTLFYLLTLDFPFKPGQLSGIRRPNKWWHARAGQIKGGIGSFAGHRTDRFIVGRRSGKSAPDRQGSEWSHSRMPKDRGQFVG